MRFCSLALLAGCFAILAATGPQAPPASQEFDRLAQEAAAIKDRHIDSLFRLPKVVGAGVGASKQNPRQPVIQVFVERKLTDKEHRRFPKILENVPVVIVVTGPFRALPESAKRTAGTSK